jgi:translation initiation factor 1
VTWYETGVKRKRPRPAAPTRDDNTRLVYSTGGETPPPTETPGPAPKRPPGIRLRLERRASGRVVTVVTGLPGTPDEVAARARRLKAACGTGGTVKDGALELQGDHRERLEGELAAEGLPSRRSGG